MKVEECVRSGRARVTDHDLVLSGVGHFAVIEVVPLPVVLVPGVGGVCTHVTVKATSSKSCDKGTCDMKQKPYNVRL